MMYKIARVTAVIGVLSSLGFLASGCGLFVLPSDTSENKTQASSPSATSDEVEKASAKEFIVEQFVDDVGTNNVTPSQFIVMDVEPFKDGYAGLVGYAPAFRGNVQSPPSHVQAYYIKHKGNSFERIQVSGYDFDTTLGQTEYDTSSNHNTLCRLWINSKNPQSKNESLQQCMKDKPYTEAFASKPASSSVPVS